MKKIILIGSLCVVKILGLTQVYAHDHDHDHDHSHHMKPKAAIDLTQAKKTSNVKIKECWIRLMQEGLPSAAFFKMHNKADKDYLLVAAQSKALGPIMLHGTGKKDGGHSMIELDKVLIKKGESFDFKPGGHHLMFDPDYNKIKTDQKIPIDFIFKNNKYTQADCLVKPANALSY